VLGEMAKWGLKFGAKTKEPSLNKLMDNFESVRKELREVYKKEFKELEKE
jgi:hypothetical protein